VRGAYSRCCRLPCSSALAGAARERDYQRPWLPKKPGEAPADDVAATEAGLAAGKHRVTFGGRPALPGHGQSQVAPRDPRAAQPAGSGVELLHSLKRFIGVAGGGGGGDVDVDEGERGGEDDGGEDAGALAALEDGADLGNGHEIWSGCAPALCPQ
jgi:hypothetical protein